MSPPNDVSSVRCTVGITEHEIILVQLAQIQILRDALGLIDTFAWTAVSADCEESRLELQRRIDACRKAMKVTDRARVEVSSHDD